MHCKSATAATYVGRYVSRNYRMHVLQSACSIESNIWQTDNTCQGPEPKNRIFQQANDKRQGLVGRKRYWLIFTGLHAMDL